MRHLHSRIVAAAIAAFTVAMTVLLPSAVLAEMPELVSWDSLVPATVPYDDPFADMAYEYKSDLRDVLKARQARTVGSAPPELQAAEVEALARLTAAGMNPDYLLAQRLVVMERRKEEATGITAAHLGKKILLDGYALPLEWEGERAVEFLLVPWVGACIHTPPPPPNQVVHVHYPQGLQLDRWFEPLRIAGTLQHEAAAHTLFLIDGSRDIPASYKLAGVTLAGVPGNVTAASMSELPLITQVQVRVNGLFTSGMAAMQGGDSISAMVIALLFSFAYGVLHTLGPGHGKTVVISYFVGVGGNLRRGLTMGARIAVFHVLSAVVAVVLLDTAWRQATGNAPADTHAIRLGSYALIMVIGAVMLCQAVTVWRNDRRSQQSARHHHAHGHASCAACAPPKGGNMLAVAVGAVPCTGALLVMLFGLANDLIVPAIIMVVAISAGMALAMSAIGMSALWARNWVETRWAPSPARRRRFETGAQLTGSACVLIIGSVLFAITLMLEPVKGKLGNETTPQVAETASRGS